MLEGNLVRLTPSQTDFIQTDETTKATALVTGFGGGKSFILCCKLIELKMKFPKADLLYLLPTYSMFRDILFPTLLELLESTNIKYKLNKTTGEIYFDVGGRVILKSMDNPDTIVGMNVFAVFFDELDTLPAEKAEQVWIKAIARARKAIQKKDSFGEPLWLPNGKPDNYINPLYVGTTPEGYRFVYKMFEKEKPDNYKLIQASGRENIYLPADYYDNLRAIYPDELVDAYIDGKFVNMSQGTVYKSYNRHSCDSFAIYRVGEPLHISVDFNVMNMNAVVYVERESLLQLGEELPLYQYNDKPTLHAIKHLGGKKYKIKDTPEMIETIEDMYPNSIINIYPDASGKNASSKGFTTSDISLFKDAGFNCFYPKKNPKIMDRVVTANSAFKTGLVKIHKDNCPEVAEALETQTFNPTTELPEKSASNSIDDINDSATYIIHFRYPVNRKLFRSETRKEN